MLKLSVKEQHSKLQNEFLGKPSKNKITKKGLHTHFSVLLLGYAFYLTGTFCYQHSATMLSPTTTSNIPSYALQSLWETFMPLFLVIQALLFILAALFALFARKVPGKKVMFTVALLAGIALIAGASCILFLQQISSQSPTQEFLESGVLESGKSAIFSTDSSSFLPLLSLNFSPEISQLSLPLVITAISLAIGDVLFALAWGYLATTLPLRRMFSTVIICFLIGLILYFLITLLPYQTMIYMVIFTIAVSTFLLLRALKQCFVPKTVPLTSKTFVLSLQLLWRPLVITAVFAFMSGMMSVMPGQSMLSLATFQQISIVASLLIISLLLLPALLLKSTPSITSAYRIALPITAAGFLLLPFIWQTFAGVTNALVNMGYMTVSIILWCMMASCVASTRLPAPAVFGIGLALITVLNLLGKIAGSISASLAGNNFTALAAIALCSIYLLSMLSLFVFKGKQSTRKHASKQAEASTEETAEKAKPTERSMQTKISQINYQISQERYSQHFAEVVNKAGLSPREQELLPLLAQGRSIANIARVSYVSENTAKSHIRSIYRKLGVHSKQELIDLLDASHDSAILHNSLH